MNPDGNSGLGVMTCPCRFINDCHKRPTLVGDGWGAGVYRKALCLPLHFAVKKKSTAKDKNKNKRRKDNTPMLACISIEQSSEKMQDFNNPGYM